MSQKYTELESAAAGTAIETVLATTAPAATMALTEFLIKNLHNVRYMVIDLTLAPPFRRRDTMPKQR